MAALAWSGIHHLRSHRNRFIGGATMIAWWALALLAVSQLLASLGAVFMKKGSADFRISASQWRNWQLILGIALYTLSAMFFVPALKGGDLSVIYPVSSVSYILVAVWSVKMLGEHMTRRKMAGMALLVVGVSLTLLAA
ncbi:EamA family transporter [Candidatus Woesearchaeota archaeon]|nr:EamA family transporter [Candidatus Woesearchaeota archaeon]